MALTDAEGLVTTTYEYDAFGAVTINGPDDQPFQYTGRENDGTGLYYYRARYYSPEMRRFISEDPIGLRAGINFYRYVVNNPLKWIDPFGLEPCDNTPGNIPDQPPAFDNYNTVPYPPPPDWSVDYTWQEFYDTIDHDMAMKYINKLIELLLPFKSNLPSHAPPYSPYSPNGDPGGGDA